MRYACCAAACPTASSPPSSPTNDAPAKPPSTAPWAPSTATVTRSAPASRGRLDIGASGSATRYAADLPVHRRAPGPVRGRADRPAHLLRSRRASAVEAGAVGHHHHRVAGRLLRARRAWSTAAGIAVRQPEDVGAPAPRRSRSQAHPPSPPPWLFTGDDQIG